jgi:hypothetical protein
MHLISLYSNASDTKRILEEWLKSPIEYQGELEVSAMGSLKAMS